jgi:hypothetical protein
MPHLEAHKILYFIAYRDYFVSPPPHLGPGGESHSLAGEGGGPHSDEGTDTLELDVYHNPSTLYSILMRTYYSFKKFNVLTPCGQSGESKWREQIFYSLTFFATVQLPKIKTI